MKEIFLVRHGETYAKTNENDLGEPFVCGSGSEISRNTHLTENGKKQMFEVGEQYKEVDFDMVIVSGLVRSYESALAFLKGAEKENLIDEIIVNPGVTEINYGEDDGVAEKIVIEKKKKFFKEFPDKNGDLSFAFPGAESFQEAGSRMREEIKKIYKKHAGSKILVVSHSGSMRALVGNVVPGKDLNFGEVVKISFSKDGDIQVN